MQKAMAEIRAKARRPLIPMTVDKLFEFGAGGQGIGDAEMLKAAQYVHFESTNRVARLTLSLEQLPCGLSHMPSAIATHDRYVESFVDLNEAKLPTTPEEERAFRKVVDRVKRRHLTVAQTLGTAIAELKRETKRNDPLYEIQEALDRFYIARIGIRMLLGQYLAMPSSGPGVVGIICEHTSPALVAKEAADKAMQLGRMHHGHAPKISIEGNVDLRFRYIPSHLHHMLLELLKNSVRATCSHHAKSSKLPPIRVIIAGGTEDVSIKVSDEGGGIPRSGLDRIWTYFYTTANTPLSEEFSTENEIDSLAGYGVGLPMTRLYARYFGGDLQLMSMEGYGTDAYLHMNRVGSHHEVFDVTSEYGSRTSSAMVPKCPIPTNECQHLDDCPDPNVRLAQRGR